MRYEKSFPAVPLGVGAIRREVVALARECGLDRTDADEVALAVSEAATNAIVHGYRGDEGLIHVSASREGDKLRIVIADDGRGLHPREDSPGLGLGLPIIAHVAESVEIVSNGAGTEIHMDFRCGPREAG
jgi:serine/threonine-protein kinase RsbW